VNVWAGLARRYDQHVLTRIDRARLGERAFTIVSDDCWGGAVYQRLGLRYRTPFVGLSIAAPDYLTLLGDLRANVEGPLSFRETSRWEHMARERAESSRPNYPIGVTEHGVELHFIHFDSPRDAEEKWRRRTDRIDWDRLFVKFDAGKPLVGEPERARFAALPYERKLMLLPAGDADNRGVAVPAWTYDGFQQLHRSLESFDVVDWLNGGNGNPGRLRAARAAARH
jgi:uncharacterized protein (DUF1919 family)